MYTHEINSKKGAVEQLLHILQSMHHREEQLRPVLAEVHPNFHISSRNFVHYLALRSLDIRPLQDYLHRKGLSSLANSEGHTLEQIQSVLRWLKPEHSTTDMIPCDFQTSKILSSLIADRLLGKSDLAGQLPSIMVTFSSEFADSVRPIEELLKAGMTIARINCAHDDPDVWLKMIENLRRSIFKTGHNCKVYMDIAGPKIRTWRIADKGGLKLEEGMRFFITSDETAVRPSGGSEFGSGHVPAIIAVHPESIIGSIREGDQVYFDDGKFKCVCEAVVGDLAELVVVRISSKKALLREEKGINFPDTELGLDALTAEDLEYLPFICEHADLVGYSYVQNVEDIKRLRHQMSMYTKHPPSMILKIERLMAVNNLPAMMLEGMKDPAFGVMIARGDLAVEIGFERLSEIQQEILWICEAAHVPVIWATQVLEKMSKRGFAARSEISDVVLGGTADCFMLNKGPYIVKTVNTLVDILQRRSRIYDRKRYILRPLSIAEHFLDSSVEEFVTV
jgi:pyruvate kinase